MGKKAKKKKDKKDKKSKDGGPKYSAGARVMVLRSNGKWEEATVQSVTDESCYMLKLSSGGTKEIFPDEVGECVKPHEDGAAPDVSDSESVSSKKAKKDKKDKKEKKG